MTQTTSKRAAMRRAFIQRGVDASFETIASHCSVHSNTDITRKDWRNYKSRIRCGDEKFANMTSKSRAVRQALAELGVDAEFGPVAKLCRKQGIIINRHDLHNGRSLFKKNGNSHPTPPKQFLLTADPTNGGNTKMEAFKPLDAAEAVKMVKELANRLGGMESLRRLIDAMA